MTFISSDIYLPAEPQSSELIKPNSPRIGIQNVTNEGNIQRSSTELTTNPAWLTSVPSSADRWKTSSNTIHQWSAFLDGAEIDFIGIAAMRGVVGAQLRAWYIPVGGGTPVDIIPSQIVINNNSIFINFTKVSVASVFVEIRSTSPISIEIGVIKLGVSVALPRNIYVGHTPITYGRNTKKLISNSDNGQYLGQVSLKTSLMSAVDMDNIPPDYWRDILYPLFVIPADTQAFFWAWRP